MALVIDAVRFGLGGRGGRKDAHVARRPARARLREQGYKGAPATTSELLQAEVNESVTRNV
jgi:hypothetical protein